MLFCVELLKCVVHTVISIADNRSSYAIHMHLRMSMHVHKVSHRCAQETIQSSPVHGTQGGEGQLTANLVEAWACMLLHSHHGNSKLCIYYLKIHNLQVNRYSRGGANIQNTQLCVMPWIWGPKVTCRQTQSGITSFDDKHNRVKNSSDHVWKSCINEGVYELWWRARAVVMEHASGMESWLSLLMVVLHFVLANTVTDRGSILQPLNVYSSILKEICGGWWKWRTLCF